MTLKRVIPTYMNMYMLLVPMYPIRLRNNIIFGLCYMIFSGIGSNFFLNGAHMHSTLQVLKYVKQLLHLFTHRILLSSKHALRSTISMCKLSYIPKSCSVLV